MASVQPTFSLITALHNKGDHIADTIRSVLAQSRGDWELIVVENGSTDQGPDIARSFSDNRIRVVENSALGVCRARNFGLREATGRFVLFLDADDMLAEGALEAFSQSIATDPKAEIHVGTWAEFNSSSPTHLLHKRPPLFGESGETLLDSAIAIAPWPIHTALVSRAHLEANQIRFNETFDQLQSEDTAFWFDALIGTTLRWFDATVALYRKGMPNSRDAIRSCALRLASIRAFTGANAESFRRRTGADLTRGQRETIARVYESCLGLSRQAGALETAKESARQADVWFRSFLSCRPRIIVRQILGTSATQTLTSRFKTRV